MCIDKERRKRIDSKSGKLIEDIDKQRRSDSFVENGSEKGNGNIEPIIEDVKKGY